LFVRGIGTGNRQEARGKRQEARGKRQEARGKLFIFSILLPIFQNMSETQ